MKTLDEIKQMMAAGETALADEALKELLEAEPNNLQAKMLYGTCRQLLGDEETFKRIHDELAPVMAKLSDVSLGEAMAAPLETLSLWKKYQSLWVRLIVYGLILAGTGAGVWWFFGESVRVYYSAFYGERGTAPRMIMHSISNPLDVACCAPNPDVLRWPPINISTGEDAPGCK